MCPWKFVLIQMDALVSVQDCTGSEVSKNSSMYNCADYH